MKRQPPKKNKSKLLRLKNPVTVTAYQSATQAIKQTHLLRVSQKTGKVAKIQYKTKNKSQVERHCLLQSTYYCQALYRDFASLMTTRLPQSKKISPRLPCQLGPKLGCM